MNDLINLLSIGPVGPVSPQIALVREKQRILSCGEFPRKKEEGLGGPQVKEECGGKYKS